MREDLAIAEVMKRITEE
jgi:hypothetical protein